MFIGKVKIKKMQCEVLFDCGVVLMIKVSGSCESEW